MTNYRQYGSIVVLDPASSAGRQKHMIQETLRQLGFSEKEIDIYLIILQQGKIAPADIAKLTKINRSTVYDVAHELIARGVITQDLGSSVRYFVARPPEDLLQLVDREEKELTQKRKLISNAVIELSSFAKNKRYSVPKIQFFSEEEIDSFLHRQTPLWNKSITELSDVWWGFQDVSFVKYYTPWLEWYWKNYSDTGVKLLSNAAHDKKIAEHGFHKNRNIRYWKDAKDFTATQWVIGDYLIMIITNQRPHYAVEIHDAVMAHNQRRVFQAIWNGLDKRD